MNALGQELTALLAQPRLRAFLRLLREGETSQDDDKAYRTVVGGALVTSLDDHPRRLVRIERLKLSSTAAGAYQFLSRTWDECVKALGLKDFSPASQDAAAVFLVRRRGALPDVLAGRLREAIIKCNREWASLPGSPYGQGELTWERATAVYNRWLDSFGDQPVPVQPPPPTPAKETSMGPIAIAAATELIKRVPTLIRMFGNNPEITERNAKVVEMAVDVVTASTGARNAQEAVEVLDQQPDMVKVADTAVKEQYVTLMEAGGGGIAGAREADVARMNREGPWWDALLRSHSFWMGALLLPLVYLIVFSIIGLAGSVEWSQDVRASIAGLIVGTIIGGLMGYYFGQTTSRNRSGTVEEARR